MGIEHNVTVFNYSVLAIAQSCANVSSSFLLAAVCVGLLL